jgi:hypothetical protein
MQSGASGAVPCSYAASNGHHNGVPSYYPHPQHYGHAAYAEPPAPLMDAVGPYPQGPYYDRGAPVYDGYGQSYGQAPTYPPSYGTNHSPPPPKMDFIANSHILFLSFFLRRGGSTCYGYTLWGHALSTRPIWAGILWRGRRRKHR